MNYLSQLELKRTDMRLKEELPTTKKKVIQLSKRIVRFINMLISHCLEHLFAWTDLYCLSCFLHPRSSISEVLNESVSDSEVLGEGLWLVSHDSWCLLLCRCRPSYCRQVGMGGRGMEVGRLGGQHGAWQMQILIYM